MTWIGKRRLENLPPEVRELYEDFSVIKEGGIYGSPENFNSMTISWFLNEANAPDVPNVEGSDQYEFTTLREIKPNEELTIAPGTYNSKHLGRKGK